MFVVLLKYCLLINSINYVQSIAINTNDLMEYANNNPPIKSYDFVNNDLKTHKKCRRASKDDQQNDDITNQLKNVQQLKEEVANLSNLVQILRDQQYLLTLLNDVDEFGNKQSRDGVDIMVLKDEVDQLRNQMEESRKEATNTDQIEKTLKEQIEEERKEIDSLKKTIVKILDARNDLKTKNSNEITKQKTDVAKSKQLLTKLEKELFDLKQKINEENSENNDEAIVRAPLDLKLPKDIKPIIKNPVVKPPELKFVLPDPLHLKNPISNQRNAEEDQSRNLRIFDDDINQMESKLNKLEHQRKFQQRDSSTNLRKLLKSIDDDSDEDIDEFVDEFKKQLSKKKRKQQKEERVKALIKSLDKSNDLDSLESKSDDDTDTLKLLLKVLDKSKPQSKSDDIDNELKLLQQAIDEMQPKDEIDLIDDRDDDLNLNKLLALRGGKSQKVDKIALLRKQLLQLKKQRPLDSISHNPYTNSGPYANRNFYPYPFPMNSNMYSTNPMNSNGYPLSFVNSYPTNSNFYPVNSNSYAINSNAYPSGTNAYNSHPIGTNPYPIASSNSFSVNNNPYTSNSNSYASNSNAYPINSNAYSIPNSLYDNLMSNYYHQSNEQKSYNKPQLNNYPFGNLNKLQYSNAQPQPSLNSYSSNFFHVAGSPLPNYQEAHQEIYKPAINPIQTNQQESQDYQAQTVNVGQDYTQQKVDDLRNQIYNLQGVINNLNKPEYVQKPEDQQMIYNLDTRINELKNVIGHLNEKSYVVPQPQNNHNEYPPINYHSNIEPSYAQPKSHSDESNHELITIHDDEHHEEARHRSARSTDSDLKQIVSILEKHLLNEDDQNNKVTARSNLDLNEKLEELKEQLETKLHPVSSRINPEMNYYTNPYQHSNPYQYSMPYNDDKSKDLKKDKKEDIFDKLIEKIIDKIISKITKAFPKIMQSIFELIFYGKGDYSGDGYGVSYNNYGFFGYLPMIALKLLSHVTSFIYKLQKNNFLRTFLVPILVVGIVAGLIIFLTWWLQPNNYYNNYPSTSYDSYAIGPSNPYNGYSSNSYNNYPPSNPYGSYSSSNSYANYPSNPYGKYGFTNPYRTTDSYNNDIQRMAQTNNGLTIQDNFE